jgi:hypothetical protein
VFGDAGRAALGRCDRFFMLTRLLHREDALHPWLYARCREVEANPNGYLDLWAREHYKSTIITFAGSIQQMVLDPESTIVIFSHTKPVARKFFNQIRTELETNDDLKRVYPDIFWDDPRKESPRWSEDKGIVVKRLLNPKEATLEAYGLVDGMPTGGHWRLRIYDDVVVPESVTSPEMVAKTTAAWELSDNLGARLEDDTAGPRGTQARATRSPTPITTSWSATRSSRACTRPPTRALRTASPCSCPRRCGSRRRSPKAPAPSPARCSRTRRRASRPRSTRRGCRSKTCARPRSTSTSWWTRPTRARRARTTPRWRWWASTAR